MTSDIPVPTEKDRDDAVLWFWDVLTRHLPQMGRDLTRLLAGVDPEVPSGLSCESNPASTERGTP